MDRMPQNLILVPVFAQAMLTVFVLILLGRVRARSMKERGQTLDDLALATDADWNTTATKVANNFKNQFEIPILFYSVCAFALITRTVDPAMLGLACLFVLSRTVHTMVHVGRNIVAWRGGAFLLGVATVVTMWVLLLVRALSTGS
jgi:hypothetical protein